MSVTKTKVDFKRELKGLYAAHREPELVDVPELTFLMIDGRGDPNTAIEYVQAIEALFTIAYAARFAVKRAPDGIDYSVPPLEGLWRTRNVSMFTGENKSSWEWTMMIPQPDVVTAEVFDKARLVASERKPLDAIRRVRLERFEEGLAAQVLHVGPYATETPTIRRLHAFIAEEGYERTGQHHEIYLGDPRRAAPEKLKTIIRQPVRRAV
jgi:hypothetical protein